MLNIIILLLAAIFGLCFGYFLRRFIAQKKQDSSEFRSQKALEEAKIKAREILLASKDKALKYTEEAKIEEEERRKNILTLERRLAQREKFLDQRLGSLDKRQKYLEKDKDQIQEAKEEVVQIKKKQLATLEKVANLSREEAAKVLLEMTESGMKEQLVARIRKLEQINQEELNRKSRELLSLAIQRCASSHAAESTATTVSLPSDDMKGRIIGREGRNINAIEKLTGVEIIVDDTPGTIVVSGFSPVRRQVAKRALEKLIADGRIHPARIEETIAEAKKEIAQDMKEAGEAACYDAGVAGLPTQIVQLLGRLKYRTSYGQNILQHSLEVSHLSRLLAEELGLDSALAKKAGLLHDIGKAVDHEIKGTHIEIGKNILKKFGIDNNIIQAMESHHEDTPHASTEAVIVTTADAISGARVGARKDSYEDYLNRLEDLEAVANNFPGVEKSYAIQAGREIRVFVTPDAVDDLAAIKLCQKIASKIEEELKYPGEIKVSVIRETRAVEYAR
ncbi:ribonuclease Y [bacterium (Candidatus Torokbacteria) CG09_land_8_20_14_0_10_42_11]|nr:MAG: ribonuclease Y [bacterium (Candidatus Torokbacteria) CG09_land_8_20_14_0_10_42_11]